MNKVEHENGYIHMYAIVVCDDCLQAFDTCDAEVYLSSFECASPPLGGWRGVASRLSVL